MQENGTGKSTEEVLEDTSQLDFHAGLKLEDESAPEPEDTQRRRKVVGLDTTGMVAVEDGATEELTSEDTRPGVNNSKEDDGFSTARFSDEKVQKLSEEEVRRFGFPGEHVSDPNVSAQTHSTLLAEEPGMPTFEENPTASDMVPVTAEMTPQEQELHESQVRLLKILEKELSKIADNPPGKKKAIVDGLTYAIIPHIPPTEGDIEYRIIVAEEANPRKEKADRTINFTWSDPIPLKVYSWDKTGTVAQGHDWLAESTDFEDFLKSLLLV